jgi:hypothetical protein
MTCHCNCLSVRLCGLICNCTSSRPSDWCLCLKLNFLKFIVQLHVGNVSAATICVQANYACKTVHIEPNITLFRPHSRHPWNIGTKTCRWRIIQPNLGALMVAGTACGSSDYGYHDR